MNEGIREFLEEQAFYTFNFENDKLFLYGKNIELPETFDSVKSFITFLEEEASKASTEDYMSYFFSSLSQVVNKIKDNLNEDK